MRRCRRASRPIRRSTRSHLLLQPHEAVMSDGAPLDAGVYVDLDQLIALEQKGRKVSLLPRQPVHSLLSGRYASRMRGRGLNFEQIRDYRSGDAVRSIDSESTSRVHIHTV